MLQPNTTFDNHYTLIRQLGRGGFSEVWLAHDSYMDIDVAIKIYAPGQGMDSNSINEFRREITRVFQLNHPNLLCPKHLGIWENMPYLIMAYCPAGSCLKFVGNISESEIWHLIHDVAAGLAYLHEKDIVHQDIKPDNILIDSEGNYLITDFGISTRARSTLRKSVMSTTNSAGTLAYMGPERFSTQPAPTKASDIWSLGAMLYELLEGVTPFPPDFGGSMLNAGAAIPTINAPVSENIKQTIYKMLSKETWDRPTATTLVEWTKNPFGVWANDDNEQSSPLDEIDFSMQITSTPIDKMDERAALYNNICPSIPLKVRFLRYAGADGVFGKICFYDDHFIFKTSPWCWFLFLLFWDIRNVKIYYKDIISLSIHQYIDKHTAVHIQGFESLHEIFLGNSASAKKRLIQNKELVYLLEFYRRRYHISIAKETFFMPTAYIDGDLMASDEKPGAMSDESLLSIVKLILSKYS